jgi:RNA polymerase sigma-54 factor
LNIVNAKSSQAQTQGQTQTQTLTMKLWLIQHIRLLQMPYDELQDVVKTEVLENPVVEVIGEGAGPKAKNGSKNKEVNWEEYLDDIKKTVHYAGEEFYGGEQVLPEPFEISEKPLCEHLLEQLHASVSSDRELKIGKVIIGYIDNGGYLKASAEEIRSHIDLKGENITAGEIDAVITIMQSFDPTGVCARNAAECLLLQYHAFEDKKKLPKKLDEIIKNHLSDISENRYKNIAKALSISMKQVMKCVNFIKNNLNPWPGLKYASGGDNSTVEPEAFIEKKGEEFVVSVKDYYVPHIRLDPEYERMLLSENSDPEIKTFIREKLNRALFVLKCIEKRHETVKKVVECIFDNQKEFFVHDNDILRLKPLIMDEVAGETGLNESTISRTISGKYVQTPRGVFELKFFFSPGLRMADGGEISTKAVKHVIKQMVSKESAAKPFSDREIVNALVDKGIVIARRTVVKYREELNIPASSKRKRFTGARGQRA